MPSPNPTSAATDQVCATYDHVDDNVKFSFQARTNEQIFAGLCKGHQTISSIQQHRSRNLALLTNLSRTTATPVFYMREWSDFLFNYDALLDHSPSHSCIAWSFAGVFSPTVRSRKTGQVSRKIRAILWHIPIVNIAFNSHRNVRYRELLYYLDVIGIWNSVLPFFLQSVIWSSRITIGKGIEIRWTISMNSFVFVTLGTI